MRYKKRDVFHEVTTPLILVIPFPERVTGFRTHLFRGHSPALL